MPTQPTAQPRQVCTHDGQYEIVVLDADNAPARVIYRSEHYAAALGYLSRNLTRRANLDMTLNGRFVDWQLTPGLLGLAEDPRLIGQPA